MEDVLGVEAAIAAVGHGRRLVTRHWFHSEPVALRLLSAFVRSHIREPKPTLIEKRLEACLDEMRVAR